MESNLHKGLTNRSPKACDKSMSLPGKSIDNDSVRTAVAPNQKTLGPRDA